MGKTDSTGFSMTWAATGVTVTQPTKVKLALPKDTEQYRDRIALVVAGIEFIKIRHPLNAAWKSSSSDTWRLHTNYILGEKVRLREIINEHGTVVRAPSWDLVLQYDQAIRDRAAELMSEGVLPDGGSYDIAAALAAARSCQELRRDEFLDRMTGTTPKTAATSSNGNDNIGQKTIRKRERSSSRDHKRRPRQRPDKAKGGRKGGGKGRGNSGTPKADNKTLHTKFNGQSICFNFNRGTKCNRKPCKMQHACQRCLAAHPLTECPAAA